MSKNINKSKAASIVKILADNFLIKKISNKLNLICSNIQRKGYLFYENWIVPPQNETLLELKRREFRERTKYLDPKILYNLSEEEKSELRDNGYFVDLDKKTIDQIKNFKITLNRHEGKYKIGNFYYNFDLYNTKYYYMDQQVGLFHGDPDFLNKIWRFRSGIKYFILYYSFFLFLFWINYHIIRRRYVTIRQKIKNQDKTIDYFPLNFSK